MRDYLQSSKILYLFMAIENEGSTEKINRIYCYVLHIYDGETLDECEEKMSEIFFGIMNHLK
ncbi:10620_t:CDS:2 [Funneliformis geosporum]|nr:10620_t:CDS:2 [Funneliformis geosporum]